MTSPARRLTHAMRPTWPDVLLALGVAAAAVFGTEVLVRASGTGMQFDPVRIALLVIGALPLAVRDRFPLAVMGIAIATASAYTYLGFDGGFYTISVVLAIWAAVSAGHRLPALAASLVLMVAVAGAALTVRSGLAAEPDGALWLAGWLVASIVLGEVSRNRRSYLEQVEQRALEAERTREEEARRRAGEERMRIARELHDVLAHHISVINVQAGVAVHLLDRQPDQARTALVAISQASKEAMRELRGTLGVLRGVDEDDPRTPAPGLDQLPELVERTRSTNLDVTVEVGGEPRPLPPAVDLAAYRIVQESLTNVTRHAAAEHVTVSIEHAPGALTVTVQDDGRGIAADAPPSTGNGLTGMRERAASVGGTVEAGSAPDGGFRVRATLPIGDRR